METFPRKPTSESLTTGSLTTGNMVSELNKFFAELDLQIQQCNSVIEACREPHMETNLIWMEPILERFDDFYAPRLLSEEQ